MFNSKEGSAEQINCADPQDFRKVYNATMQLLFKVSFRIVNDEEVAEDLVHDSYIKANEKKLVFPSTLRVYSVIRPLNILICTPLHIFQQA